MRKVPYKCPLCGVLTLRTKTLYDEKGKPVPVCKRCGAGRTYSIHEEVIRFEANS